MYSNLIFAIFCTLIGISSIFSFTINFDSCEVMGGNSFAIENNWKCQIPGNMDDQKCSEEYYKGCDIARTKDICREGANFVLNNNNNKEMNCSILKFNTMKETNVSRSCCEACQLGLNKFKNNQQCDSFPSDSDNLDYYINSEMERCCKLKDNFKLNGCGELNCEHGCMIKESKKKCVCENGYQLNDDGINCDDINECNDDKRCSPNQLCHNTPGSYKCLDQNIERIERSEPNLDDGFMEGEEISTENTTVNEYFNSEPNHNLQIDNDISTNKESEFDNTSINPKLNLKSNANLFNLEINLIVLLSFFYVLNQIYQI